MSIDVVPIASVDIRPRDIDAVATVLSSGRLRQGEVVARFEEAFAARVGAEHAVAVSSGTAALHLIYLALFRPGDEVIVPAFTFVATASMLLAVGAVPVFADVDPRTFTLTTDEVRSRITVRTAGIAGVHLFGNASDIDGVAEVAAGNGLALVWDAAQALGTEYRGREIGGIPSAACYSFYPTKNITTGEGGMITTNDPVVAAKLRLSRAQGAEAKYVHTGLGFNYRMTDFQAALGLEQLGRLDEYLVARRSNAAYLSRSLQGIEGLDLPQPTPGARHSFNQYSILVRPPLPRRDEVVTALRLAGIETAVHYPRPLHRQPLFSDSNANRLLPNSDSVSEKILSLPVHPGLSAQQLARTAEAVVRLGDGAVPARQPPPARR